LQPAIWRLFGRDVDLEVEAENEASEIVKGDPFVAAGIILNWNIRQLACWSAKEFKGK